jgi:hypothetical protein
MGFRHLFAFNLAMLAKQGWRFIQNPNSLVCRLFKAIYFPTTSFWNAEIGLSPSYAWRSIFHGRDVLCSGIRRHVGDGCTTNIWTDPWLQGENLSQYYRPHVQLVSDLFHHQGSWNLDLLRELFPIDVVNKIRALPLSLNSYADRWIWGADKHGLFTVKSAYHVARSLILNEDSDGPNPSASLWNGIWTAQVPSKVKICAWKACANILPTRSRLSERGIDIDTHCPLCEEEVESPLHALRDCSVASEALSIAQFAPLSVVTQQSSVHEWLLFQVSHLSKRSFSALLMLIWAIWRNRNSMVWDALSKPAVEFVPLTLGWWEEFRIVHATPTKLPRSHSQKWKKPGLGFIKLNVDASFHQASGTAGLGGVFRDSNGSFLGGFFEFKTSISSAKHAELLAALLGVQLASFHSLVPLLVESDCMEIVQATKSNQLDSSDLGFLLADFRQAMHTASAAILYHVCRSANTVAHLLANEAHSHQRMFDFFTVAPSCVKEALAHDCNDFNQ